MRTCENPACATEFKPKMRQRFCSPRCRHIVWVAANPPEIPNRNHGVARCEVCDDWFTLGRPDQRRCSQECSNAYHGVLRCPRRISVCEECDHEYLTRRTGQQYCSKVCAAGRKRGTRKDALVYFIQAANGPVKIGIAANPDERLRQIQSGNPYALAIRRVEPGGRRREYELHCLFADHRMEGEWFAPVPELVALLQ